MTEDRQRMVGQFLVCVADVLTVLALVGLMVLVVAVLL